MGAILWGSSTAEHSTDNAEVAGSTPVPTTNLNKETTMTKVWILVLFSSIGGEIEIAAYDTLEDCLEVSYYMNADLARQAETKCFVDH